MPSNLVSETSAGQSASAFVILKGKRHVANVTAAYGKGGRVLVNVFNYGSENKSAPLNMQHGSAGGYGYDKFTAALSGLEIDGHKLSNHCDGRKEPPKGGVWPKGSKAPKGWHFANFSTRDRDGNDLPAELHGWESCYRESGLDYLKARGYRVIQAL